MKKLLKFSLLVLILTTIYVIYINYPRLNIITGFAAKSVCSCTFVAQRNQQSIEKEDNDIDPIYLAKNVINHQDKSVTSTVFGLKKRIAIFKDGVGCVLLPEDNLLLKSNTYQPNRKNSVNNLPYPYGNGAQKELIFNNINYADLEKAVNNAFDKEGAFIKKTRSLLVIYNNQIIAEKYAPGFTKETKLLGWSMTKSLTGTIVGILEKQGKINVNQHNLFKEWEQDTRSKITIHDLLQMNSGLAWVEDYNTISDITKMLFLEKDMSQIQLQKSFVGEPNNSWNYSSGTTNLISKFIRNQFKTHQQYLDFWYDALIDKIGMHSMILETDLSGNYVGSSYGWATTRDWAKLGLLYLHDGNWNGEQLLNTSWIDYTTTPTNGSNGAYGAHFWLNAGGVYPDAPRDLYSCNGYQGQHIFIIPSKNLVIVRMGLTEAPEFDFNSLLKEITGSIK